MRTGLDIFELVGFEDNNKWHMHSKSQNNKVKSLDIQSNIRG